jgi:hypothetical protein
MLSRWEVANTSPNPQAGGPSPFSPVHDCLFHILAATIHVGVHSSLHNMRMRHAVGQEPCAMPWDRNPQEPTYHMLLSLLLLHKVIYILSLWVMWVEQLYCFYQIYTPYIVFTLSLLLILYIFTHGSIATPAILLLCLLNGHCTTCSVVRISYEPFIVHMYHILNMINFICNIILLYHVVGSYTV